MKIQTYTPRSIFFIFLLFLWVLTFVTIPAFAQQLRSKVVVVDTEKAIEDSIWGKKTLEELGKEQDSWRNRLEQFKKEQIQPLEEQLAKQKAFLDNEQAEEKLRNEINIKMQDMEGMIQQGNMALAGKQEELLKPILEELKELIKRLSIKEGYDIVLEKRVIILYVNPELEITSQVTTMLDEIYKDKVAKSKGPEQASTEKDSEKKDEKTQN